MKINKLLPQKFIPVNILLEDEYDLNQMIAVLEFAEDEYELAHLGLRYSYNTREFLVTLHRRLSKEV